MIIIGAGRVGGAIAQRAQDAGLEHTLVNRTDGWEAIEGSDAPIFVAVRNDDLATVLDKVPSAAHKRLVFTQNGMLRPWLAQRGLEDCTRGLLFFAVPSRGASLSPGGESPFVGPQAEAVADWLGNIEVPASTPGATAFAVTELEKLVWNCCFGLLCEHTDAPVGDVVAQHDPLLSRLADELLHLGMPAFGLDLDEAAREALKERLRSYSRSIPDYRGAVKEWPWRNGWFVDAASAPGLHEELLAKTGHLPR
ncbi:MAG: ketopantoate reductase family protein [Nannocystales bacterium]